MAKYSRTNLIINYLPQDYSDDEFRSLFSSVAPVKRAKVCRDKRTGYSFGFGFCEFYTSEDAARAIAALNGLRLLRKTIKVAYARLQSAESKNCNLHLTNLPPGITSADVHTVLSPYGGIINCKILCDGQGASRGIGFCLFETRSAASDALQALHGKPWPGLPDTDAPVQVRFADENEKKVRPPAIVPSAGHTHSAVGAPVLPLPPPPPPPPPPLPQASYDFGPFYASGGIQAPPLPTAAPFISGPYGYPAALPYQFYPHPHLAAPPPQPQLPQQPPPPPPPPPPQLDPVVCVCNLPPGIDESQLCAMFAPFGCLADVLLEPPAGHQPAPAEGDLQGPGASAMIAFTTYQSAAGAAAHWNGQPVSGRLIQAWLRRSEHCCCC